MTMLKRLTVAAAFAAVALAIIAAGAASAMAQGQQNGGPPAPGSTQAANGPAPGQAVVSWQAVASATHYRIGWVAYDDYNAAIAAGRDWLEAFTFVDLANRGQTSHRIARLTPGINYAFIVGSSASRYAAPTWSDWASLTLAAAPGTTSCPTTPPPPPDNRATPIPTPTPTPVTGMDYDSDDNGLIEISNLAQLDAIRYDMDGNGVPSRHDNAQTKYGQAYPNASTNMGCPYAGCTGYELVTDLDFDTNGNGAADDGDAYWNDSEGWQPIYPLEARGYRATLEGNGHTIANLFVHQTNTDIPYGVGLFAVIGRGASIRNLRLTNPDIFAVGSLGDAGALDGPGNAGALAGTNNGTVTAVIIVSGRVIAHTEPTFAGGLVGLNSTGGRILASASSAAVTGYYGAGGLAGHNGGTIIACYATGDVTAGQYAGGLVGSINEGSITTSYATGHVRHVQADSSAPGNPLRFQGLEGPPQLGGLVGYTSRRTAANYWDAHDSYWDIETSRVSVSVVGVGKTTEELQASTGYTGIYKLWNVPLFPANQTPDDPWDFGTDSQYPVLKYGGLNVAAQRP